MVEVEEVVGDEAPDRAHGSRRSGREVAGALPTEGGGWEGEASASGLGIHGDQWGVEVGRLRSE